MGNLRAGQILWVDLSSGKSWTEPTEKYARFIGGRGINTKIVYDHVGPGIKAYDPGNVLVFGTGPMTGTLVPGTSRCEVTSKSPLTELLGMSNLGGYWAAELKFAGYDHLAITGKAEKPVYLFIENGKVEIRDAGHLWGRSTYDMAPTIRKELGDPNIQVVSIGKGGENRVRYASILTKIGNGAGRTGMGGVMGSKNLKAIAVRGTGGVQLADAERFYEASANAQTILREPDQYKETHEHSTAAGIRSLAVDGFRIIGNNETNHWDGTERLNLLEFVEGNMVKRAGCFSCPIVCMDQYNVPGHGSAVASCIIYSEAIFKVKQEDMTAWFDSIQFCQEQAIDIATVFSTIAWAIDLYQKGILTDKETGGMKLEYGNPDLIVELVRKIVSRDGLGDLLAEGQVVAAKRVGRGAEEHTYHTKGTPHLTTNQVHFPARALATSVGPRADLLRSDGGVPVYGEHAIHAGLEWADRYRQHAEEIGGSKAAADPFSYEGKAKIIAYYEKATAISDIMLHCKWHGHWSAMPITPEVLAELYSIGTGRNTNVEELWQAAARLRTLERAYNLREGQTRADDTVPSKYFTERVAGTFSDHMLSREKFEEMKTEYYGLMGWDPETGLPTQEGLERIGLPEVAEDLEKAGRLAVPQPAPVPA